MSNELTEAERAARAAMIANPMGCWCVGASCHECLNAVAAVVAAVRPIIEADALYDAADRYLDLSEDERRYPADLMRAWAAEKHDKIKG